MDINDQYRFGYKERDDPEPWIHPKCGWCGEKLPLDEGGVSTQNYKWVTIYHPDKLKYDNGFPMCLKCYEKKGAE